ncbi:hypothetical protein BJY52DRAFT_1222156 [Lactarius psammicola]|nr:hypothetical protein BJY52DRAFT_1222156 [Lactarius psammicola]
MGRNEQGSSQMRIDNPKYEFTPTHENKRILRAKELDGCSNGLRPRTPRDSRAIVPVEHCDTVVPDACADPMARSHHAVEWRVRLEPWPSLQEPSIVFVVTIKGRHPGPLQLFVPERVNEAGKCESGASVIYVPLATQQATRSEALVPYELDRVGSSVIPVTVVSEELVGLLLSGSFYEPKIENVNNRSENEHKGNVDLSCHSLSKPIVCSHSAFVVLRGERQEGARCRLFSEEPDASIVTLTNVKPAVYAPSVATYEFSTSRSGLRGQTKSLQRSDNIWSSALNATTHRLVTVLLVPTKTLAKTQDCRIDVAATVPGGPKFVEGLKGAKDWLSKQSKNHRTKDLPNEAKEQGLIRITANAPSAMWKPRQQVRPLRIAGLLLAFPGGSYLAEDIRRHAQ